jgi:DedD protein
VSAAAEPPAKAPAAGGGDWIVQLGSFSSRANADRLAADVKRKGFSVSVQGGGGSSGTLFRVRAGPEPDKAGAEALAVRLAEAGFKGGRVGRR